MRSGLLAVSLLAAFLAYMVSASCQAADRTVPVPADVRAFLDKLGPNTGLIPGNRWGWRLGPLSLIGVYEIGGQAIGLLADPKHSALLNLRTSYAERLSLFEQEEFYKSALPFRLTSGSQSLQGWYPDVTGGLGGGSACIPPFSDYIRAHTSDRTVSRIFFAVELTPQPVLQHGAICDGDVDETGSIRSQLHDLAASPIELTDGTMFVLLGVGGFDEKLLRLDDRLRAHSTLGGDVYLLDAKPVDGALLKGPRDGNLDFLCEVMRQMLLKQYGVKAE